MKTPLPHGSPRALLGRAARSGDAAAAWDVFEAYANTETAQMDLHAYNALLGLLVDKPEKFQSVMRHMSCAGVKPNEATLTLQVRRLLAMDDLNAAAEVVWGARRLGIRPKRRLYAGLLDKLTDAGRLSAAAKVTVSMDAGGLTPGEDQLVGLSEMCARASSRAALAHLAQSAGMNENPVDTFATGVRHSGATSSHGAVATESHEGDVGSTSGETFMTSTLLAASRRLSSSPVTWLASLLDTLVAQHDVLTHRSFERLRAALRGTPGWSVREVSIGASDGICSGCGTSLASAPLTSEQRAIFGESLLLAARERGSFHSERLREFGQWVSARRYSYIIDGANVAYRLQNFSGGQFSYKQVQMIMDVVESRTGQPPLLVLPIAYVTGTRVPNHTQKKRSGPTKQSLPRTPSDESIVRRWRQSPHLWTVPDGADDDWYWMLATLVCNGGAESTTLVVTNDGMRDHASAAVLQQHQAIFRRWAQRHVAKFDFTHAWTEDVVAPQVTITDPPPLAICSQATRAGDGRAWHLPKGTDGDAWLCIATDDVDSGRECADAGV